jgi:PilZ domain
MHLRRTVEVTCTSERILKKQVLNSRRHSKRVETPQGVWVFWRCGRTEDTSRVKDLSAGGLFIETLKVCPVDATVELHFLVEDGEIRANATVRYVKPGVGIGLQFKTVRNEDHEHFSRMIKRLIQPSERAILTS